MVLPLAVLLIGGGIFQGAQALTKRKTFSKQQDFGGAYLKSLDAQCAEARVAQPGGLASQCLPQEQRDALRAGMDAARSLDDIKSIMTLGGTMLSQQFGVHSFNEEQKYKWAALDQRRQAFDAQESQRIIQNRHNANTTDTEIQTDLGLARTLQERVTHPLTGVETIRPMAGTKANDLLREKAAAAADGLELISDLAADISVNGVLTDPESVGFGRQRSKGSQMISAIKKAEVLGMLDAGVIKLTTGLVGGQDDLSNFFVGTDAAVLERIIETQRMFVNPYRFQRDQIQTIPGVSPSDRARFDLIGQRYTDQAPRLDLILKAAQFGGGDLTGPAEQARIDEIEALPFIERNAARLEIGTRKLIHQAFNLF